jgi:hypothetical protein
LQKERKKERKKETLNLKLNTKPLKFKWGLAKGEGGGGEGWSTHARHGYPHLVGYKKPIKKSWDFFCPQVPFF